MNSSALGSPSNSRGRTEAMLIASANVMPAIAITLETQVSVNDPDPASQLPLATQTGANTLGCLVNGQPWTPQGNNGSSNYTVSYDQTPFGVLYLTWLF